jgi:hypothetical protein
VEKHKEARRLPASLAVHKTPDITGSSSGHLSGRGRIQKDGMPRQTTNPMKTPILSIFATIQILACTAICADGPMNSGLVQSLSKEHGTLTLRTEQGTAGSIVYHGMDKADILTASGKLAKMADISPGQRVSVFYGKRGGQWVVSRVLIADPTPAPAVPAAPAATATLPAPVPAVTSRAATDGDITTKPANSAAIDGDRTTRAPNSAATDGDRTTVPAEGSRGALHRK